MFQLNTPVVFIADAALLLSYIPVQFLWFDGDDRDDDDDVAGDGDGDGDDGGGDAANDDFMASVILMLEPLCQSCLSMCSLSVATPCGLC